MRQFTRCVYCTVVATDMGQRLTGHTCYSGLLPKRTKTIVNEELDTWAKA